jgi:hypothetical protein
VLVSFKRRNYSKNEIKGLSLIYSLIGVFLLIGNLIGFVFEGGSVTLYLSAFTGIMFLSTGILYRVKFNRNRNKF